MLASIAAHPALKMWSVLNAFVVGGLGGVTVVGLREEEKGLLEGGDDEAAWAAPV